MRYLICLSVLFSASLLSSSVLAAKAQRAIFQLTVNQVEKGEVFVLLREGDVLARVSDLEGAGLRGFSGNRETIFGETYVSLRSLGPDVQYESDEKELAVRLTAQPALLGTTSVDLYYPRPPGIIYSSDTTAFLNYAFNYIFGWQAANRFAVFSEAGISMKNSLLYSSVSRNTDGSIIRGMTNLTLDNRQSLIRWIAGDSVASSGGSLGGGAVIGGLSVSREFSLDPYFFRYPSFGLSGALQTPSTVDIYVNGLLVRREKLVPGLFELRNLPVPSGSSTSRIVIRDAFGREQEINSPFYFTPRVLAPGLHEYSYNLGFRRENIALASWDYGPLVFLGRHRVGIRDWLTAGLQLEATSGLVSGGPAISARLPFGEMEFSAAGSSEQGQNGGGVSLLYTYLGLPVSFGASVRLLSPSYANLSLKATDGRPKLAADAFVGFQVGPRTSVGLRYSYAGYRDKGPESRLSIVSTTRLTDRLNLYLTGRRSLQVDGNVNEFLVGLNYYFGNQISGSLSHNKSGAEATNSVDLQKSLPVGSGFGFRFRAEHAEKEDRVNGVLQYQGPYGRYEVDHQHVDRREVTTLNVAGGLVAIGGTVYPSRPIQDSFAVIRVPGVAGVRGYASNQELGETNSRGDLIVPNLLSYYGNFLRIADEDIPLNHSIETTEKTVAPPFRGGAVVTFPVRRFQGVTGSIVVEISGEAKAPAYGRLIVTVGEKKSESPIGKLGEFYFENLPVGRHPAVVEYKATTCQFTLEVPASDAPVLKLGTLRCTVPQTSGQSK